MLESPYGSLKEVAVEQLFEWLSTDEVELSSEGHERTMAILMETPWTSAGEMERISAAREELEALLKS